jgi:hypothetical protein
MRDCLHFSVFRPFFEIAPSTGVTACKIRDSCRITALERGLEVVCGKLEAIKRRLGTDK